MALLLFLVWLTNSRFNHVIKNAPLFLCCRLTTSILQARQHPNIVVRQVRRLSELDESGRQTCPIEPSILSMFLFETKNRCQALNKLPGQVGRLATLNLREVISRDIYLLGKLALA